MGAFSDFIFYADESGDHSLSSIDQAYPIFALALCGFRKKPYSASVVPRFQTLKFRYFGHDTIILHERDIRKQTGPFSVLQDETLRQAFLAELSKNISATRFQVAAVVIDKRKFRGDLFPEHPYHLSLKLCLQMCYQYLVRFKQENLTTHFIFEKRGEKEDKELELEFRRIAQGINDFKRPFPEFRFLSVDKRTNSTGMQIADLVARPIGLSVLRPDQPNQAYDAVRRKTLRSLDKRFIPSGVQIPR